MLASWMLLAGLFQYRIDAVRRTETAQAVMQAQGAAKTPSETLVAAAARRRFEEMFNRLVTVMDEFQREYNASGGQVWPKKKADALRKAIKDLELR